MSNPKINQVDELLITKNISSIDQLFGTFQLEIDKVVIGCILLDIDYSVYRDLFFQLLKNDDYKLASVLEEYIHSELKFRKALIPYTVRTARVLFFDFSDKNTESKEIVMEIKDQTDYLTQVCEDKIFDKNIIIISANIDFTNEKFIDQIKKNLRSLQNLVFLEPAEQTLLDHFELLPFCQFNESTVDQLTNFIAKYKNDIIRPMDIKLTIEVKECGLSVYIDHSEIKNDLSDFLDKIDFKELFKIFMEEFQGEIKSEILENSIKVAIASAWGLGLVDVGIKGVKQLIFAVQKMNKSLNEDDLLNNYKSYMASGLTNVKDWYSTRLKTDLGLIEKHSNISVFDNLSNEYFDKKYQEFMSQYIFFYLKHKDESIQKKNNTQIFIECYEHVYSYSYSNLTVISKY